MTPAIRRQVSRYQRGDGLTRSTFMLPISRSKTIDRAICMPLNSRISPTSPGTMYSS